MYWDHAMGNDKKMKGLAPRHRSRNAMFIADWHVIYAGISITHWFWINHANFWHDLRQIYN